MHAHARCQTAQEQLAQPPLSVHQPPGLSAHMTTQLQQPSDMSLVCSLLLPPNAWQEPYATPSLMQHPACSSDVLAILWSRTCLLAALLRWPSRSRMLH